MGHAQTLVNVQTNGKGLYEITDEAAEFIGHSDLDIGLLTIFCRHTSCSLIIQENADADVQTDLKSFFEQIAPEGMAWITHRTEGPDDMPAHIRAALTQTSLSIPIVAGRLALGIWQGIYVFEHRRDQHDREIVLHLHGEYA